jgi:hypothetical protein
MFLSSRSFRGSQRAVLAGAVLVQCSSVKQRCFVVCGMQSEPLAVFPLPTDRNEESLLLKFHSLGLFRNWVEGILRQHPILAETPSLPANEFMCDLHTLRGKHRVRFCNRRPPSWLRRDQSWRVVPAPRLRMSRRFVVRKRLLSIGADSFPAGKAIVTPQALRVCVGNPASIGKGQHGLPPRSTDRSAFELVSAGSLPGSCERFETIRDSCPSMRLSTRAQCEYRSRDTSIVLFGPQQRGREAPLTNATVTSPQRYLSGTGNSYAVRQSFGCCDLNQPWCSADETLRNLVGQKGAEVYCP